MEEVIVRISAGERPVDRAEQRAETMRLLRRMHVLPESDPCRTRLRDQVIAEHMNYARHFAHRYTRRDGISEDIEQVAYLGLVKAVDGFDPDRGTPFLAYATPMIIGEIKRHYRDATWAVHVPRRMQELTQSLHQANDALTLELGRAPTITQLAEYLDTSQEEIVEALEASDAYRTASLDRPAGDEEDGTAFCDLIGAEDPGYDLAVDLQVLRGLIAKLSDRDKRVLMMRFFRGNTQAEIGIELGVSQMQISRVISRVLAELRAGFA